jgi:hypothetical protein
MDPVKTNPPAPAVVAPVPAVSEAADLRLCNLVSQGKSLKEARAILAKSAKNKVAAKVEAKKAEAKQEEDNQKAKAGAGLL